MVFQHLALDAGGIRNICPSVGTRLSPVDHTYILPAAHSDGDRHLSRFPDREDQRRLQEDEYCPGDPELRARSLFLCPEIYPGRYVQGSKVEETLEKVAGATDNAAGIYLPAKWFANAVGKLGIADILLLVGVSVLLFALVFWIVGGSYRKINSALKSHAAAKNYRMTGQKTRSVLNAIAFKEFRRMTGSTIYMTNVGMGEVLATILSLVVVIIGFDKLVGLVTKNAPFDYSLVRPAIPFIIYFCLGMMSTAVCSPSLEGKNYWIVQSLPIEKKTLYQGKMLFNMYLTVPFMILSTLCMCISAKAPVLDTILYLILGFTLLAFSTTWGCVCGLKHMRLDWENEVEVIKQGAATAIYMFPNMFAVMGLAVLVIFLGTKVNSNVITIILILISSVLSGLCYLRAMSLARKSF